MKLLFISLLLICSTILSIAQPPEGYYNGTDGLKGEQLKTALYLIIKGHTTFPYSASSTDTWDIIKESDRDPNNSANVILFYTGWSVNAAQEYNNGAGWNREHVWANSRGDFGTDRGAGTDIHHLRAADISVNNARSNRWFANCTEPYIDEGIATSCYTSSALWVWKPRTEDIGDVARMIFYMATRYEGENGEPNLEVVNYLPTNNSTKEPIHALLSDLLEWHKADPVSDIERNRNNVIYSYQRNRNPFIDHPEFVSFIWEPDNTTNITSNVGENIQINVVHSQLLVQNIPSEATLFVYNIQGKLMKSVSTIINAETIPIDYPSGIYIVRVLTSNGNTTKKIVVE